MREEERRKKNKRETIKRKLQNGALSATGLAGRLLHHEGSTGSMFENLFDTLLGLGRALKVLLGTNLLSNGLAFVGGDWALRSSLKVFNGLGVVTQVGLAADKDDGDALAKVQDFRNPLLLDVVKGVGRVNGKADENDVRVGV